MKVKVRKCLSPAIQFRVPSGRPDFGANRIERSAGAHQLRQPSRRTNRQPLSPSPSLPPSPRAQALAHLLFKMTAQLQRSSAASVKQLPQRLQNFFARYPPQTYSAQFGATLPPTRSKDSPVIEVASNASPSAPNATATETIPTTTPPSQHPNPFLPYRNPETNRWQSPQISLRRQADLVKLASKHGVEPLLPPGLKSTEYKQQKLEEKGLRIKGTGIGEKVKGHKWERTLKGRLEERRKAMEGMPEMVRLWQQVSNLPLMHSIEFRVGPEVDADLDIFAAGPWPRMEEVSQMSV